MKQIFTVLLVVCTVTLNAQSDTAEKQVAVVLGGSFGGGWSTSNATSGYNYEEMVQEKPFYVTYTGYCAVLFKEKIGFRISAGRLGGSSITSSSIDEYGLIAFPGHHYLPEYSELHTGYHYTYFAPQFTYRLGDEPFNATFSLGGGMGKLHTPHGTAIFQKNGSNDFIELTYHGQDTWNTHGQLDIEFAYMRQLSQHVFANVGLYTTTIALLSNYEFHYTETDYQQTYTLTDGGHSGNVMMHFNAGLFLNLQWNKRESERAYYE